MQVLTRPPSGFPALVLNADFRPLSYYPLSLWPWEEAVKAVYQDRVDVVSLYDKVVRSPSMEMQLPSVIALKSYVDQDRSPAFTRFNVFLRDGFTCQYCSQTDRADLRPRHSPLAGRAHDLGKHRRRLFALQSAQGRPHPPSGPDADPPRAGPPQLPGSLQDAGRRFPPHYLHQSWLDYLYWDIELEP
jgi:hypothetical protein